MGQSCANQPEVEQSPDVAQMRTAEFCVLFVRRIVLQSRDLVCELMVIGEYLIWRYV